MKISYADYLKIMHPELRDPETERRRLITLAEAQQNFPEPLTSEALLRGIPVTIKPMQDTPQP